MGKANLLWFLNLVCLIALVGCGSSTPTPPAHNRNYFTPQGHPIGHLKPEEWDGPPRDAAGKIIKAHDPVKWEIRGSEVTIPEYEIDVQAFRLDFDETKIMDESILPYPLMTAAREVAVHQGKPPEPFSHPEINNGEVLLPVYACSKGDCSRVKQIDNYALFPADPSQAEIKCPFCGNSEVKPYVMPQHHNLKQFLERHPDVGK